MQTGRIELLHGCMFGGKTEELLRRLKACDAADVQAFKHARDDRYGAEAIVSHGGMKFPALPVATAAQLHSCVSLHARVIGIDEGHFFDDQLPEVCARLRQDGRRVIITALQPNSWGVPFAMIERLTRMADQAELVLAICSRCGRPADRTQRTKPVTAGRIVGGPEAFEPRCGLCWAAPPEPMVD